MAIKQYITAQEVMELWDIKATKAYAIIRAVNDELRANGCIIVAGKAPRRIVLRKLGLDETDVAETEARLGEDVPWYGEVTPENG
ncbi:MAG: hypothetical protein E7199_07770 [Schwartzia succinivorans]|nr:hypothetical protein [Schwartzia succinivorans]